MKTLKNLGLVLLGLIVIVIIGYCIFTAGKI